MLTTEGMALRAALLSDPGAASPDDGIADSRMVMIPEPCLCQGNKSGRRVDTTKSTAKQTVTDWANMSQNFCMAFSAL
jgi:hypothetical protein